MQQIADYSEYFRNAEEIVSRIFLIYPELKQPSQSLKIQEKIKENFSLNLNIFTIDRISRKLRSEKEKNPIAEGNYRDYFGKQNATN